MQIIARLFILLIALSAISSNAALYDRGNGMIYDNSLNITWLQDANYAKTSGVDDDGAMTWQQANDWAANLIYGRYSDWRLPSARLIGNDEFSVDGSTDWSFNNAHSEIGHLFLELGNTAYCDSSGSASCGKSIIIGWRNNTFTDTATNQAVSFINVQEYSGYWETESYLAPYDSYAWRFDADYGLHEYYLKRDSYYAWAVRDGDVLSVGEIPAPAAAWLMGSGLIGLAGIARRKK